MFRLSLVRAVRTSAPRQTRSFAVRSQPALLTKCTRLSPSLVLQSIRSYSAPAELTRDEIQGRIMDLLKNFDKITDATKIEPTAHFGGDLGLDSLDTVEVVMAIEEEFSIEIPDKDADVINSIDQAVEYISAQPDAH